MFVKEEIEKRIEELGAIQPWNHSIELPYGINTTAQNQVSHGKNLIKWSRIEKHIDQFKIKDKRILDIGCNEGFFSLKMAEYGAQEVVGIDADRCRIEKAQFISDVLQISNIHYEVADIFDKNIEKFGYFDFALCMGFLHRVPYPYQAMQQLAKVCDTILFEWKCLKEGSFDLPIAKFCGGKSKDSNKYSGLYWLPSIQCVADILETLGFTHNLIIDDSTWRRAIILSSRVDSPLFSNKNIIKTSKPVILKKITRSYLAGILRILKDKSIKWM